jgi:ribonuclease Y
MFNDVNFTYIGLGVLGGVFFFILGYVIRKHVAKKKLKYAEEKATTILEETKKEVDNRRREVEIEAKDRLHKMRTEFDNETKDRRRELTGLEKRLIQKEENLEKKVDLLDKREREVCSVYRD